MTRMFRSRGIVAAVTLAVLGSISPAHAAPGAIIDACSAVASGDLRVAPTTGCSPLLEDALQLQGAGDASGLECAGCVHTTDIAAAAVGSTQVADGSLTEADLAFDPSTQADIDAANPRLALGGTRFATLDATSGAGYAVSATVGADGLPVMSYIGGWPADPHLRVARCATRSCAGEATATTVDPMFGAASTTSIALGADGLPIVAYQDGSTLKILHCGNAACSAGNSIVTPIGVATAWPSIAIGADGLAVISFHESNKLRVLHCADLPCATFTAATVAFGIGPSTDGSTAIALGADGLPVIAYRNTSDQDLVVAHCGNATCTGPNTINVVDGATSSVGVQISLTIGADGMPVMSYVDPVLEDLKIAHCRTVLCPGGGDIVVADTSVPAWVRSNSITIGADGLPIVVYNGSAGLALFHCGSVECNRSSSSVVLDNAAQNAASVTLDAEGRPLVVYLSHLGSPGTFRLRMAGCRNPFCAPHFRRR